MPPVRQRHGGDTPPHRPWLLASRQAIATQQIEAIVETLAPHDIPILLLKGAAQWTELYAPGERAVRDIDLLLPRSRLPEAVRRLEPLGYEELRNPGRPVLHREHYHRVLIPTGPRPRFTVELHWQLAEVGRYRIDPRRLFDRAEPCRLGGVPTARLCREDALLHLAIHRLNDPHPPDQREIAAAHRSIRDGTVDWRALLDRARAWGCALPLWLLLDSARAGYGTAVPPEVLCQLRPGPARRRYLLRLARRREGVWQIDTARWPSPARRFALLPLAVDSPRQAARYLRAAAGRRLRDFVAAEDRLAYLLSLDALRSPAGRD